MSLPPQKFREIVLQLLYSHDMGRSNDTDMLPFLMAELSVAKPHVVKAQARAHNIREKQIEIDALISKNSSSYDFERIQSVERNILRLAVFELLYDADIPDKVAIAEAIRLARKFSTPESASFINAILDQIKKEKDANSTE